MLSVAPPPRGHRRGLLPGRRGVAAIEFSLVAPVMATLVIGMFDTVKGFIIYEEVQDTARVVGLSASTLSVQADGSTSLTVAQVQLVESSVWAEMPWTRLGIEKGSMFVTLSSIYPVPSAATCTITAPPNSCTYTPEVVWSVPYSVGPSGYTNFVTTQTTITLPSQAVNGATRPCTVGTVTYSNPGSAFSLKTIPLANVVTQFPFLVADVSYQFTPAYLHFLTGPITFTASYFPPMRIGGDTQYVEYDITNAAANNTTQSTDANLCEGGPPPVAPATTSTAPWL